MRKDHLQARCLKDKTAGSAETAVTDVGGQYSGPPRARQQQARSDTRSLVTKARQEHAGVLGRWCKRSGPYIKS